MSNTNNRAPDNSRPPSSLQTHEQMRELLDAYSTYELEEKDLVLLNQHLMECAECQETLEAIRQIRAVLTQPIPNAAAEETALFDSSPTNPATSSIVDAVMHALPARGLSRQGNTKPMDVPSPVSDSSPVSLVEAQMGPRPAASDVIEAPPIPALFRAMKRLPKLRKRETFRMHDVPEIEDDKNSVLQFNNQESRLYPMSSRIRGGRWRNFVAVAAVLILIVSSVLVFTSVHVSSDRGNLGGGNAHHTPDASDSPTASRSTQAVPEVPNEGWTKLWTLPAIEVTNAPAPIKPYIAWSSANDQTLYLCRNGMFVTFSETPPPTKSPLLYRSIDGGTTWLALTLPEPAAACTIHPDAAVPHRIVLQDDRGNSFVSNDAGEHWQPIRLPSSLASISGLSAVAAGGRIYVGGYWTTDLQTWSRWYPGVDASQFTPMAVNPQHPDTIYALLNGCAGAPASPAWAHYGLCRSDNGGQTWHFQVTLQVAPGSPETFCLAPANPDMLYVWAPGGVLANGRHIDGLVRSTDGGNTWEPVKALDYRGGAIPLSPADAPCSAPTPGIYGTDLTMTDDGTLFLASASKQVMLEQPVPAGVSVYKDGNWKFVTTYPLRQNGSNGADVQIEWLLQSPGKYRLMSLSASALYCSSSVFAP